MVSVSSWLFLQFEVFLTWRHCCCLVKLSDALLIQSKKCQPLVQLFVVFLGGDTNSSSRCCSSSACVWEYVRLWRTSSPSHRSSPESGEGEGNDRSLGVSVHSSSGCYHRGRRGDRWADYWRGEKRVDRGGGMGGQADRGGKLREVCLKKKASPPFSSFTFLNCSLLSVCLFPTTSTAKIKWGWSYEI